MKSGGRIPLISPWLYRISVRSLVRRAAAGDVPAVRELAFVFCTSTDPRARDLAIQGLMNLPSPEQADSLCHEALLHDYPALITLVKDHNYLPSAPGGRALFLFCTFRLQELRMLDKDDHLSLLAGGYAAVPETVRARVRSAARTQGTCSTLARALTGTSVTENAARWSYDEWDVVITGLVAEEQWDDLWLLAVLAPLPLAVTAITTLKNAGWSPRGDDLPLWNDIVASVVEHWTYPVPAVRDRALAGRPAGQVSRLIFSPDGSLLATGSTDGMIAVWRTTTMGLATEISIGMGSIRSLTITADNRLLVYCGDDGIIYCHNLEENARLWSWTGNGPATAISLSPDSRTVLVADETSSLHALDTRDGRALYTMPVHPSPVTCLASAPSDPTVACGHADGSVSCVRFEGDRIPQVLAGSKTPVRSLAFIQDGSKCLVVSDNGLPALVDPATGENIRTFPGQNGQAICSAVPGSGGWLAVGSSDHTIRCWDLQEQSPAATIPLYSRTITCCSAVPDGSLLATGFHDGTVRVYSMPGGKLIREFKGHKKTITTCAIASDGSRLATVSWDGTTKLWRLPTGEIIRTFNTHAGRITALAGPSGTLLAIVTSDGIARILDDSDGQVIRTIDLYTPEIRAAAMNRDGTFLASAGTNATLRLWNIRDGSLVTASDSLATSQRCCAFLPDSSALITGGWDGACRIFRTPDLTLTRTLSGHTSTVTCCTLSGDGSLFITGSNDTTVRFWRTAEDEAYAVLKESRTEVSAVALSPDETLLAAGSGDGVIRLYRLPYGTGAEELKGLPGKVTVLAFTPDGCTLIASYDSGVCAIFSLVGRYIIRTIPAHTGAVTGIAVLPDNKTLVTTGDDGRCRFHPLPQTPFPARTGLEEMEDTVIGIDTPGKNDDGAQWAFLRTVLAARFRSEIGICPPLEVPGCYDIQIVG